jgi:hydroxyacylglutathione hydrolase
MKKKNTVHQLQLGGMANFSYIILDNASHNAAVVDPNNDTDSILEVLNSNKLTLSHILLTHGHFDHIGGAALLSKKFNAPVHLSLHESPLYSVKAPNLIQTKDNDTVSLGESQITCIHTPGHTPGCQCFLVDNNLFTGDTLFIDAVGRIDLPGGNGTILFQSLQRIKTLPDTTVIWPGHDYGAASSDTLLHLKQTNPFLACSSEEEFLDFFM